MVRFSDFKTQENENRLKTEKNFSKEIELFEKNFNISCEISEWFFEKYTKSKLPVPRKLYPLAFMIPRFLVSLKSIFNLTTIGYYYDANILIRTFFENLGLCVYLTKNEDQFTKWIQGKKVDVPYYRLFQEPFSILFGNLSEKFLDTVNWIYGRVSSFVHSDAQAQIPLFITLKEVPTSIEKPVIIDVNLLPYYEESKIAETLVFFASTLMSVVLLELFNEEELHLKHQKKIKELIFETIAISDIERLEKNPTTKDSC